MERLKDPQLKKWVKDGGAIAGRSDGRGLTFTLSTSGTAVWVLRYRFKGRQREYTIGTYPDTCLSRARELATGLRGRIQEGEDVASTKQADKAREALNASTFKQLAGEWLDRTTSEPYRSKVRRALENYAFPLIGRLAPDGIHSSHIDRVLKEAVNAGAPTTANDLLRYMKRVFAFAKKRRIVSDNPAADFDPSDAGGAEKSRSRALSLDEIRLLLAAMRECETFGRGNELAFRLLLLLGVRKGELVGASWGEFDLDAGLWALPQERSKTTAEVVIPLPPLGIAWLSELKVRAANAPWVFPARRIGRRRLGHISPDTLNVALSRVEHGLPHFTVHDLRRTLRTQLAALGVASHVAERALNHKSKGVEGIYDRYDYLNERREALEQWSDVLQGLEYGASIVAIRNRA